MVRLLGHRQTKEAATDKPNLLLPRHISTLPVKRVASAVGEGAMAVTFVHRYLAESMI